MSIYTTEVRYIIDTFTTAPQGSNIQQKITGAIPAIFNFSFPIWEETYRQTLEYKILQHYYMREIGFETVGLWKFYLQRALTEKMPYFNDLYQTVSQDYDFLSPYNVVETITREVTGEGTSRDNTQQDMTGTTGDTTEGTTKQTASNSRDISGTIDNTETREGEDSGSRNNFTLNSDLPQTEVTNPQIDYGSSSIKVTDSDSRNTSGSVTGKQTEARTDAFEETVAGENKQTVSGSNENHLTGSSNSGYNDTRNENITNTRKGNPGNKSYSELIQEYREALINIDMLVIESLNNLFFGLWG